VRNPYTVVSNQDAAFNCCCKCPAVSMVTFHRNNDYTE
jgi:hypothetical protein